MSMDDGMTSRIDAIRKDKIHGASFFAKEALRLLRRVAQNFALSDPAAFLEELRRLSRILLQARPTMSGPMMNAIVRLLYPVQDLMDRGGTGEGMKRLALDVVDQLLAASEEAVAKAAQNAADLVEDGMTVLTHSYSATCLEAIRRCRAKRVQVVVTESRPLYEGRRTAVEVAACDIPVTLITDAEAGHFMGEADIVLSGADAVLVNGDVINKMGTYLVALAANDNTVPFFVVCDTWKFAIGAREIVLEEKEGAEIFPEFPPFRVRNVYFDLTPAHLVTGIVTEEKVFEPARVGEYSQKWKRYLDAVNPFAQEEEEQPRPENPLF